jgi:hypothetical protein
MAYHLYHLTMSIGETTNGFPFVHLTRSIAETTNALSCISLDHEHKRNHQWLTIYIT